MMQHEYKETMNTKFKSEGKASPLPITTHVPAVPQIAMRMNSSPSLVHRSTAGKLAEAIIPNLEATDKYSSARVVETDSIAERKDSQNENHFSSEGITTSDDDFSVTSDLLSRLSMSAISMQDQLCSAAFMGNESVVAALLMKKVQVNACGMSGWTALHEAVNGGHHNVVKMLCDHGADPIGVLSKASQKNAIQLAIDANSAEMVNIMYAAVTKIKSKRIVSLENQLEAMQSEYKRLFKSISMTAFRKKKKIKSKRQATYREFMKGSSSNSNAESSESDGSDGSLIKSDSEVASVGSGDSERRSSPIFDNYHTGADSPEVMAFAPSSTSASARGGHHNALDEPEYAPAEGFVGGQTELVQVKVNSYKNTTHGTQLPRLTNRRHKSYAMRDIQMILFMFHTRRIDLLLQAINKWNEYLLQDRKARPQFKGRFRQNTKGLRRESPSSATGQHINNRNDSDGASSSIKKWLRRGYRTGVQNSMSNSFQTTNVEPSSMNALGATEYRGHMTSLNHLMRLHVARHQGSV